MIWRHIRLHGCGSWWNAGVAVATRLAFGSSVPKSCHRRCGTGVRGGCRRRSDGRGSTSAPAPRGGCSFWWLWHTDLFVVPRGRERRSSGQSATGHRARASATQRDRDSRGPPHRGSGDGYRRSRRLVPLCGGVAHHPGGAGRHTQAAESPKPGQGRRPLSEHADDHGISRYDDMHARKDPGRSALVWAAVGCLILRLLL